MLLTWIGQKGREIYDTFTFNSADDQMTLEHVLNKFSEFCNPRKNVSILCHKFFMYRQLKGQSFHDFIMELKKLSTECEFENLQDPSLKIWSFVVQMTMPFMRGFWENLTSPFWKLLLVDMLLRRLENMPMRSSSSNQPVTSTKLISSVNLVTKFPTKTQKRKLRNVNFEMAPIPEENTQHMESCI